MNFNTPLLNMGCQASDIAMYGGQHARVQMNQLWMPYGEFNQPSIKYAISSGWSQNGGGFSADLNGLKDEFCARCDPNAWRPTRDASEGSFPG
jgi:hypothetical protein